MMVDDGIYTNDLLAMNLHSVSDLFLEKLCETGKRCIKCDIPGVDENEEKYTLRVCLCKEVKE